MTAFTPRLSAVLLAALLAASAPLAVAQAPADPLPIAVAERTLPAPPAAEPMAHAWQPTINVLTRADAARTRSFDRHNARTADLLNDLRRGRMQTLPDYLAADVLPEGPSDIATVIELFENAHGAIVDYAVHGSVPRTEKAVYTFAEVRFADRTSAVLRLTWKDDGLVSLVHAQPLVDAEATQTIGAWQPTINWLADVTDGSAAQFDAYNATASRLLRAIEHGNTRPLHRQLRADRQDRGVADVQRMLAVFEAEHGAIDQSAVLGTVPRTDRSAYTFTELRFADGHKATFRMTWLDGRLTGLAASPPLFGATSR